MLTRWALKRVGAFAQRVEKRLLAEAAERKAPHGHARRIIIPRSSVAP